MSLYIQRMPIASAFLMLAVCNLNVDVDEDDTPVTGNTVVELLVIQHDQNQAFHTFDQHGGKLNE